MFGTYGCAPGESTALKIRRKWKWNTKIYQVLVQKCIHSNDSLGVQNRCHPKLVMLAPEADPFTDDRDESYATRRQVDAL